MTTMDSNSKISIKPASAISSSTFSNSHFTSLPLTTTSTTHQPPTSPQWRSTLESIKLLYLQRKYKQCAARCMELMNDGVMLSRRKEIHPVYKACLAFYTAISYEMLGRAAHQNSSNKIPLLRDALEGFVCCQKSLDDAVVVVDNQEGVDEDGWSEGERSVVVNSYPGPDTDADTDAETETMGSLVNSITRIIESSLICATQDDPFVSDYEYYQDKDRCKGKSIKAAVKKSKARKDDGEDDDHGHLLVRPLRLSSQTHNRLHPSPLKIRKSSVPIMLSGNATEPAAAAATESRRTCSSPPKIDLDVSGRRGREAQTLTRTHCQSPSPLKIVPSDTAILNHISRGRGKGRVSETRPKTHTTAHPEHSSQTSTQTLISEEEMRHIVRFNNTIASLRDQIASSTLAVQGLIDKVKETQRLHRAVIMSGRAISSWSFSPLNSMSGSHTTTSAYTNSQPRMYVLGATETKEQRIVRLRAEGWNTVGIKSMRRGWKGAEYYRAFCSAVLDELYLER